jgi:phospholipid/cholesterol/gamma-HCH transport system substrate-binding protein
MQKQAPTLGRILVMAGFALSCFGLLLFLWVAFGGTVPLKPKGYQVHVDFPEATQLAQEADVRISGVPVGRVVKLALGPGDTTDATIELDQRYAPIPKDTKAMLRQKTLLGETYVELTPGIRHAGQGLADGGTLPQGQVQKTVELDEIFRSLDPRTRKDFQIWMQSTAAGLNGRGVDINAALGNLSPFASDTNTLVRLLNEQQPAVTQLVRNTGVVFDALSERNGQLSALISNSNTVIGTIASRNTQLQAAFRAFPTFERESTATLNRLDRFAHDTNPLVTQLRPAAQQLSPTLQAAARLAPSFKAFFVDLGPLITASKTGLPAFQRILGDLRPLFGQLDPFTRSLNPLLSFVAQYLPELDALIGNTAAATQGTATDGGAADPFMHFLRTISPVSPEALATYPQRLASNRPNPYRFPGAMNQLASGLSVFENRQCPNGPRPTVNLPADLATIVGGLSPNAGNLIRAIAFAYNPSNVPAPACKAQGTTPSFGTDFPHVTAQPPAASSSTSTVDAGRANGGANLASAAKP